jgi:hypothetical protein
MFLQELAKFNWRTFSNGTEIVSVRAANNSLLLHGVFDRVSMSAVPQETFAWVGANELSTVPNVQVRIAV